MREISKDQAEYLLTGTKYFNMIYKWLNILPSEFNDDYKYYYYETDTGLRRLELWVECELKSGNSVELPMFKFEELFITQDDAYEVGVEERTTQNPQQVKERTWDVKLLNEIREWL